MTDIQLTVLTAITAVLSTELIKRIIVQFFSIGKKVSYIDYKKKMEEMKGCLHDQRIFIETGLKTNRARGREYTNDVLNNSNEKRALELKGIKDIVSMSMDKLEVMIKGQTLYMSSIDKRLERIENKNAK